MANEEASTIARRTVLVSGAVVAGAGVLAACGSSTPSASTSPSAATSTANQPSSAPSTAPSSVAAGGTQVATSDVPVGGGKVLDNPQVVITQPTAGTYKAFSSICTHAGCAVGGVEQGQIICPCHGSVFSATDGSVLQGPAPTPLAPVNITVSGSSITIAG
jgi:Rieske Fe-S protein